MDVMFKPRVERRATRMHEMIARIGVDRADLARLDDGAAYCDARTTCLHCGTTDICLRWLDGTDTSTTPPAFCPNRRLFEALVASHAHYGTR